MTESSHCEPLPYLETFSKVAELGSFTAAARDLGLTQAAVSGRIRSLETELGLPVFDRRGGRVEMTPAGRKLYPLAQQILSLHQQARREVTGAELPLAGELVLAASSVPGEYLLPALLAEFRRQFPQVQVRLSVSDSQQVLEALQQGKASVGIVGVAPEAEDIQSVALTEDHLVLVVSPEHQAATKARIPAAQLCREPLILRESGSGSRQCFEQVWQDRGHRLDELNVVLELGSNEAIKEAVTRGVGAAVLSEKVVERECRAGTLKGVKLSGLPLDRKFYLVWDRRRELAPVARAFVSFLETPAAAGLLAT